MNRSDLITVLDALPPVTRQEVSGVVLSQPSDRAATTVLFDVVAGHALPGWEQVVYAVARTGASWSPPSAGRPEDIARTIALGILVEDNSDRQSERGRAVLNDVATSLLLLVQEDDAVLADVPAGEVVDLAQTLLSDAGRGVHLPFTRDALAHLAEQLDGLDPVTEDVEPEPPRWTRPPRPTGFDAILGMIDHVGEIADAAHAIFGKLFPR